MRDTLGKLFGKPTARIDGVAKVTGAARFSSDEPVNNPAFAFLVTSAIARGSIARFNLDRAKAVHGVMDILTYENVAGEAGPAPGPDGKPSTTSLESKRIWHDGQIIAIVLADTYEAAREAACRVEVEYVTETPSATFDSPGSETEPHESPRSPDPNKGDAAGAFAGAEVKVEVRLLHPDATSQSNRAVHAPRVRGMAPGSRFMNLRSSCGAPRHRPLRA